MSTILEIIGHYQRSIERSQNGSGDSASNGKLLHSIDKLYRLPITVDHLQATGIGKTVNSLRKYDGEVGVAAKALVAKWKAMVTAEEYATETIATANKTDDDEDNDDDIDDDDVNRNNGGGIDDDDGGGGGGGGEYNDNEQKSNNNKTSDKKSESKHHRNQSSSSHKNDNSNKKSSTREHSRSSSSKSKHKSDRKDEKSSSQNDFIVNESSTKAIPKYDENLDENIDNNDEKLLKCNNDLLKNDEKHHHHSSSNSNSSNRDKNNKQHSSSSKHHHHHSRTDEKSSSSKSSSSKHRKEHNRDNHKSSSKDKTHHKSSSSSSGNASSNNINKNKENPNNNINKINNNNKIDDNINKDNKRRHSITETITDGKACEVTSSSSTTTTIISSSSSSINKIKKPKIIHDEIDSTTGTSFEDALGMMIPIKLSNNSSNKNTIKIKSPNISKSNNNNNNSSSSTSKSSSSNSVGVSGNGASSSSSSSKNNTSSIHKKSNGTTTPNKTDCDDIRKMTPSLLTSSVNLKPLDPNIAIELPTISISNNYKPMPLNQTVMDCVFRSNQQQIQQKQIRTDAEALQHSISSKTMRTKVYSGQRSGQRYQPPKLFDLCIRFLQKNIDAIEYCGGYPYEILRHFLERATPSQLLNFEEWNQYIIEDTDELWQQHVQRHCRGQKRQEMESWREMYLRCKENEEHRLNMLAENIKQSQKLVAAPVKKTQLAFVDSMVKPPRSVQRKQDQFGTHKKLIATPAARVPSLCNLTPNALKIGDVRLRIAAGERDNAQVSGFIRPKKAPLMAKTLQLMKGRFKR